MSAISLTNNAIRTSSHCYSHGVVEGLLGVEALVLEDPLGVLVVPEAHPVQTAIVSGHAVRVEVVPCAMRQSPSQSCTHSPVQLL